MKYKITDLMDLYEDKNCPLTPLDKNMQKIENNKEIIEVKASKHAFDWKQGLALAASVALLVVSGFGVKALMNRSNQNPGTTLSTTASTVPSVIETTLPTEIQETALPVETNPATEPVVETTAPQLERPSLDEIKLKLNPLLSDFAQLGVGSFDSWTADEAQLVDFAVSYFDLNSITLFGKKRITEISLEQVNEFLNRIVGRTVSPEDGASYNEGHIRYQDGTFSWDGGAGDPHNCFAIGIILDNNPYDREGRVVLSVSFRIYKHLNQYGYDPALLELTMEEADAKVDAGELGFVSDGQAWVEYVDGELRMVGYELIEHEEVAGPLDADVVDSQLNPLLSAFAEQYQHNFDVLTADEEWLADFAFLYYQLHCPNFKTWDWSISLEQANDILTQLVGLTVSPEDGSSYWDGFLQYNDGIFHMEPAYGDPHSAFAIGAIMDTEPRKRNGRIVYDVAFKVYDTPELWGYDNASALTAEEADELVEDGVLEYYGAGRAEVEYVDGKLRIVHYEMHNAAE